MGKASLLSVGGIDPKLWALSSMLSINPQLNTAGMLVFGCFGGTFDNLLSMKKI